MRAGDQHQGAGVGHGIKVPLRKGFSE